MVAISERTRARPWWFPLLALFFATYLFFTLYQLSTLFHLEKAQSAAVSTQSSSSSTSRNDNTNNIINDPCSVEYWEQELALDDPRLENVKPEDLGFFHTTFSIQGSLYGNAKDKQKLQWVVNRTAEMKTSQEYLKKALPDMPYQIVELGDYPSFHQGIKAFHDWAKTSSPYHANIVIDTDLLVNPNSPQVVPSVLTWAFENVDMCISYDSDRKLLHMEDQHGVQTAFWGYRNNRRMQLLHSCVSHTMEKAIQEGSFLRQQAAVTKVLRSPVGQFIRIRWLPPEFFCSMRRLPLDKAVVKEEFIIHEKTQCLFLHSHRLADPAYEMHFNNRRKTVAV